MIGAVTSQPRKINMQWSELSITHALARQTFRENLVVVPNCTWTGHEMDLMVVTPRLQLIDVEVKVSKADLKVDARKDKWWHRRNLGMSEELERRDAAGNVIGRWREHLYEKTHRDWPPRVWKHYYALPAEIWDDALFDFLPGPKSGVIVLREQRSTAVPVAAEVIRRAQPNPEAQPISAAAAIQIARLASLRMWDAFKPIAYVRDTPAAPGAAEATL